MANNALRNFEEVVTPGLEVTLGAQSACSEGSRGDEVLERGTTNRKRLVRIQDVGYVRAKEYLENFLA